MGFQERVWGLTSFPFQPLALSRVFPMGAVKSAHIQLVGPSLPAHLSGGSGRPPSLGPGASWALYISFSEGLLIITSLSLWV